MPHVDSIKPLRCRCWPPHAEKPLVHEQAVEEGRAELWLDHDAADFRYEHVEIGCGRVAEDGDGQVTSEEKRLRAACPHDPAGTLGDSLFFAADLLLVDPKAVFVAVELAWVISASDFAFSGPPPNRALENLVGGGARCARGVARIRSLEQQPLSEAEEQPHADHVGRRGQEDARSHRRVGTGLF